MFEPSLIKLLLINLKPTIKYSSFVELIDMISGHIGLFSSVHFILLMEEPRCSDLVGLYAIDIGVHYIYQLILDSWGETKVF